MSDILASHHTCRQKSHSFPAAVSARPAVGEENGRFRVSNVKRLFTVQIVAGRGYPYDVSRDGQRFLVVAFLWSDDYAAHPGGRLVG